MTAYEIISRKRDGKKLTFSEIAFFIEGFTLGDIPDYQMSALLMAIFIRGMDEEESDALVQLYINSGESVDLTNLSGIKVDKHSTGGVGDKVSIILAPIVAAAGVPVPMVSGRGLGHSGGTLDKLESIPGFRVDYDINEFIKKLEKLNVCLIGQTAELAPADKKIYALRDVTATVQSIPLIAASIMSKKIAEGIDALVLDVKTGSGAFMIEPEKAVELARALIRIGENAGKKTVAYITDMNNPLGNTVGNWLEIEECIECLHGEGPKDLMHITYILAGTMIYLGQKAESIEEGIEVSKALVKDGSAWEKLIDIVEEQEGDASFLHKPELYPKSTYQVEYKATHSGWIESINAYEAGITGILLGAGRRMYNDPIDPKSGIRFHYKQGDKINPGEPIFTIYTDKKDVIDQAVKNLSQAVQLSEHPTKPSDLILNFLDRSNL